MLTSVETHILLYNFNVLMFCVTHYQRGVLLLRLLLARKEKEFTSLLLPKLDVQQQPPRRQRQPKLIPPRVPLCHAPNDSTLNDLQCDII